MYRLNTQTDEGAGRYRFEMIVSNMNRIESQNMKLQELLTHTDQLDRLREVADGSAQNWKKLAQLAETVEQLHKAAVKVRENMHNALTKHSEHLNKTFLT